MSRFPISHLIASAACMAAALAGASALSHPATAMAQPNSSGYDVMAYAVCLADTNAESETGRLLWLYNHQECCKKAGGVWDPDNSVCTSPQTQGSTGGRQLPRGITIQPDLGNAPAVTAEPQRPPTTVR
jgi:hypothetical protein